MKIRSVVKVALGAALTLLAARLLVPRLFEESRCRDGEPVGEAQIAAFFDARSRHEAECSKIEDECRFSLYVTGDGNIVVSKYVAKVYLFDGCRVQNHGYEQMIYDAEGNFVRTETPYS